jgi:hypothetical protein
MPSRPTVASKGMEHLSVHCPPHPHDAVMRLGQELNGRAT